MAIEVLFQKVPDDNKRWTTTLQLDQKGSLDGKEYWHLPWVMGEMWQMRGWLEGLGAAAIDGWLEFVLHEGLTTANGRLTIYEKHTQHNLEILVQKMNRIVHGIAQQYPRTDFRLKMSYTVKWSR